MMKVSVSNGRFSAGFLREAAAEVVEVMGVPGFSCHLGNAPGGRTVPLRG
jgi:hypothetical protein